MHHEKVPLIYPFKKWSEHGKLTVPITERLGSSYKTMVKTQRPQFNLQAKIQELKVVIVQDT